MKSITFFITFIPILSIILLLVNLVLAPHNPYQEKDSAFECGFHSFLGQNRTQFNISFFIFALLFLLFDLEILLVYPYSVSSYGNDIYGLAIMMVFFILLTLGFVFELGKNALTIDSKQIFIFKNKDKSNLETFTKFTINSMLISSMKRTDILQEIQGLRKNLDILKRAERLDNILTDKSQNREMKYIISHFSTFFDEESGNTREEGITQVKDYIEEEISRYKSQLGEASTKPAVESNAKPAGESSAKPAGDNTPVQTTEPTKELTSPFFISPMFFGSSIVNNLLVLFPNVSNFLVFVGHLFTLVPLIILLCLSYLNLSDLVPDSIKPYYPCINIVLLLWQIFNVFRRSYVLINNVKSILDKKQYDDLIIMFYISIIFILVYVLSNSESSIMCDAPIAWGLYFQENASLQIEALLESHRNIMYYLVKFLSLIQNK